MFWKTSHPKPAYKLIERKDRIDLGDGDVPHPVIYLGGDVRKIDSGWRETVKHSVKDRSLTLIDPTCETLPRPQWDPDGHAEYVRWERTAIEASNIILFWLGKDLQNQAARVEIGFAVGRGKIVRVGAAEGFRGADFITSYIGCPIAASVDELCEQLLVIIEEKT